MLGQAHYFKLRHIQETSSSSDDVKDPEQTMLGGGIRDRAAVHQRVLTERFDGVARHEFLTGADLCALIACHDWSFRLRDLPDSISFGLKVASRCLPDVLSLTLSGALCRQAGGEQEALQEMAARRVDGVVHVPAVVSDGYNGAKELTRLPLSSRLVMGVLKTAREVGISIPGDLALAGYGDHWPTWEPKQPNPCLASSTANIPHPQSTGYPELCGYVDPCVRGLLHTIPINLPENADWARACP